MFEPMVSCAKCRGTYQKEGSDETDEDGQIRVDDRIEPVGY